MKTSQWLSRYELRKARHRYRAQNPDDVGISIPWLPAALIRLLRRPAAGKGKVKKPMPEDQCLVSMEGLRQS